MERDLQLIFKSLLSDDGRMIEFNNGDDVIIVWFSKTTQNFIIQLNGVVIKSVKTWNVFTKHLLTLVSELIITKIVTILMCDKVLEMNNNIC